MTISFCVGEVSSSITSLVSLNYNKDTFDFNVFDIGDKDDELKFHCIDMINLFSNNITIRLGIASKQDNGYYMVYIPNDNVVIRKLTIENTISISKVFLIDGPLLIIQYITGFISVYNLINNSIGKIKMNNFILVEAKSYKNIDTDTNLNTSICLLHFIKDTDNDDVISHNWLCFDINSLTNNKNGNNHISDDDINTFNPPNISNVPLNTVTGIHYCHNVEDEGSLKTTIITTSSGYIYTYTKNRNGDTECKEQKLENDIINNDTRFTIIKITTSAIPNNSSIIIKSNNFDKLMIFSSGLLLLLLEIRRVGFFAIGNFSSSLCTQLLIGLSDDVLNDYPMILNKNEINNKSHWTLCDIPGQNGSRYILLSDVNNNWSKRGRSIICGDINKDIKKRKKNNSNKDSNNKKQKSGGDDIINEVNINTKKQLSDIDSKSQESVIDALNVHLEKIMMTADIMNDSINNKNLLLQVLRKNVNSFQNMNNSPVKLDFRLIDNSLMFLYQNQNNKNEYSKQFATNLKLNETLIVVDSAYNVTDDNSNILLFVRVLNKSNMPVFRLKTNASLISSGQGYMRETNSIFSKSGVIEIIYPNQEAIISSLICLSIDDDDRLVQIKNQRSFFNSNTTITINLSWTELKTSQTSSNLNRLSHIFMSDPIRLDIEMSHGWLGPSNKKGLGGAMIIMNRRYEKNQSILTPFLIARQDTCTNISNLINKWYYDATIVCNRQLLLASFMCNLPLITIGNNSLEIFVNDTVSVEKVSHYISIHFSNSNADTLKSNLFVTQANHSDIKINTISLSGYNRDDLYCNLSAIRNKLRPESTLLLFANNLENLELLRLVSLYLLDEMATLALAWRMMIVMKTSRKRKSVLNNTTNDNSKSFNIRITPRLITPLTIAKTIYSKQQKTDKILSYVFEKLNSFL